MFLLFIAIMHHIEYKHICGHRMTFIARCWKDNDIERCQFAGFGFM
jgi:hypothetical protein